MPALIWVGGAVLVSFIGGMLTNNATEQPSVVIGSPQGGISEMSTPVKIALYVGAGIAAVYVVKKVLKKI
jgi:hypothetical protein